MLLLLLFGFLEKDAEDPARYASVSAFSAAILSSTLCGALSALFCREAPVWTAALAGLYMSLFSLLLSLIPGGEKAPAVSLLLFAAIMLSSVSSSFAFSKLCKKNERKRRRRRRS